MKCLVCGHKLAIFRKLSLGDFCCQEHRALFLREQNDRGPARRTRSAFEPKSVTGATRVYARFLLEEVSARQDGAKWRGYGPLAPICVATPEPEPKPVPCLAPARYTEILTPHAGSRAAIGFGVISPPLRIPSNVAAINCDADKRLRPAGLVLPWSSETGPQAVFSMASLAAAAWAQSGYCKPMSARCLAGGVQFVWPTVAGKLEMPAAAAMEIAPKALPAKAAAASQPMRVRLATPSVARPKPKLEMPAPAPAQIDDHPAPHQEAFDAPPPQAAPPRNSFLGLLFTPRPQPSVTARTRSRMLDREEVFGYDEPVQSGRMSSGHAWAAMLSGWTPSAATVSGMFAVLFLFSAITIFLSAPSTMSYRTPSFRWDSLRAAIRNRAVLKFEDDFRSGLNGWTFPSGWSQDWSYDQAGFLRPGKLGFLEQSMNLVNYRLQLMGQIERKSFGWAFRAQDANNYYVAKLTVAHPGPLPMVDLIHYPVKNGKEGPKMRVRLPFAVRNDTLYQVEMNILGDQFRASVNGHVVDAWSDKSLLAGGVGFVTGQGEASRVRWIRVSDRDDFVGRVCHYLSARSYRPSDEPTLSASYHPIFAHSALLQFPR